MKDEATKKVWTPRNVDSILAGALKLELAERVDLVKRLQKSISDEVAKLQEIAKAATDLIAPQVNAR